METKFKTGNDFAQKRLVSNLFHTMIMLTHMSSRLVSINSILKLTENPFFKGGTSRNVLFR